MAESVNRLLRKDSGSIRAVPIIATFSRKSKSDTVDVTDLQQFHFSYVPASGFCRWLWWMDGFFRSADSSAVSQILVMWYVPTFQLGTFQSDAMRCQNPAKGFNVLVIVGFGRKTGALSANHLLIIKEDAVFCMKQLKEISAKHSELENGGRNEWPNDPYPNDSYSYLLVFHHSIVSQRIVNFWGT